MCLLIVFDHSHRLINPPLHLLLFLSLRDIVGCALVEIPPPLGNILNENCKGICFEGRETNYFLVYDLVLIKIAKD